MALELIVAAMKTDVPTPTHRLLLIALANHAWEDGHCFPRIETLAQAAMVSPRHTTRLLTDLCELGLLRREPNFSDRDGRRKSNRYYVLIGQLAEQSPAQSNERYRDSSAQSTERDTPRRRCRGPLNHTAGAPDMGVGGPPTPMSLATTLRTEQEEPRKDTRRTPPRRTSTAKPRHQGHGRAATDRIEDTDVPGAFEQTHGAQSNERKRSTPRRRPPHPDTGGGLADYFGERVAVAWDEVPGVADGVKQIGSHMVRLLRSHSADEVRAMVDTFVADPAVRRVRDIEPWRLFIRRTAGLESKVADAAGPSERGRAWMREQTARQHEEAEAYRAARAAAAPTGGARGGA